MLTTTEAIVLKSMKYRDTSKIVTFYSRKYGKLKGIAKGARQNNNKFGASLEPLNHVSLVVYKKEQRDLHLISQCDIIQSNSHIHDESDRMSVGLSVLELVDKLAHDEEENPQLFSLVVQTLAALNQATKSYASFRRAFQLRFAALFGFAPALDICVRCGKSLVGNESLTRVEFQLTNGSIVCSNCLKATRRQGGEGSVTLSAPAFQILRRFLTVPADTIATIVHNERIGNEIDHAMRLYFRYHFENMKELNSLHMFNSVL